MSTHKENREEQAREQRNHQRLSKLWLWVGVLVLCAILFFWIFDIGTFIGPNQ